MPAACFPQQVAVEYGAREITYRELEERANRFANGLIGLGIGPEARGRMRSVRLPRAPSGIPG